MAIRHIELTDEAGSILDELAGTYGGDTGQALSELLLARESIEDSLDALEDENAQELIRQRDRARSDFEAGRGIPWEQIKAESGL